MEIIYFVHGTTFDNADSKCSGWKQVELNELGKNQAINLGKNTDYEFDIIFTSDLVRAIDSSNLAWPKVDKIVDKRLREGKYRTKMIMQVHDELIFEVPKEELEEIKTLVLESMELGQPLRVPLDVDINYGPTWKEG